MNRPAHPEYALPNTRAVTEARQGLLNAFGEVSFTASGDARFKTENGIQVSIRNWDPCPEVIFTTPEVTLVTDLGILKPITAYVHALEAADGAG